jgi:hypothetical protein
MPSARSKSILEERVETSLSEKENIEKKLTFGPFGKKDGTKLKDILAQSSFGKDISEYTLP